MMKRVGSYINKIEKMSILAEKSDIYTIQFANENSLFAERADSVSQLINDIPSFKTHCVYSVLQHLIGINSLHANNFYLRLEITKLIFWKLGFLPFYAHTSPLSIYHLKDQIEPDQVLLCIANISSLSIDEALKEVNAIYKEYFNDSIIMNKDNAPLKEIKSRIAYFKKDFLDQLPWLEKFQANMLDTISKQSFSHFLKERLKAQFFDGTCSLHLIPAPSITKEYREACIKKHLTYPASYTAKEATVEYDYYNKKVKAKTTFPKLIGAEPRAVRYFCLDTFILEQYTIPNIFEVQKNDIVIDAGAFIGDTAIYFSNKAGNEKGKVYAFEPIAPTAESAKHNCTQNNCHNVEIIPLALSDKKEKITFEVPLGNFAAAYKVDEEKTENLITKENTFIEGKYTVETITLDEFVKNNKITTIDFIKMDVEGAEMQALKGAKDSISRFKPNCALCVYHKKNDYYDIATFLLECCPDYKFYFRCDAEPVLFATVRNNK